MTGTLRESPFPGGLVQALQLGGGTSQQGGRGGEVSGEQGVVGGAVRGAMSGREGRQQSHQNSRGPWVEGE